MQETKWNLRGFKIKNFQIVHEIYPNLDKTATIY